jgi:hypothetical protein
MTLFFSAKSLSEPSLAWSRALAMLALSNLAANFESTRVKGAVFS